MGEVLPSVETTEELTLELEKGLLLGRKCCIDRERMNSGWKMYFQARNTVEGSVFFAYQLYRIRGTQGRGRFVLSYKEFPYRPVTVFRTIGGYRA